MGLSQRLSNHHLILPLLSFCLVSPSFLHRFLSHRSRFTLFTHDWFIFLMSVTTHPCPHPPPQSSQPFILLKSMIEEPNNLAKNKLPKRNYRKSRGCDERGGMMVGQLVVSDRGNMGRRVCLSQRLLNHHLILPLFSF